MSMVTRRASTVFYNFRIVDFHLMATQRVSHHYDRTICEDSCHNYGIRIFVHWIAFYRFDSVVHFAPLRQNLSHAFFLFQADLYINAERIKIYALLAGAMVWDISRDTANIPRGELQSISRHVVNVCEGLDWKRVLAIHLW